MPELREIGVEQLKCIPVADLARAPILEIANDVPGRDR
jgi:hypothetical protein